MHGASLGFHSALMQRDFILFMLGSLDSGYHGPYFFIFYNTQLSPKLNNYKQVFLGSLNLL